MSGIEVKTETLHGRPVTYAEAGEGPVLLLIHAERVTDERGPLVPERDEHGGAGSTSPSAPR